MAIKLTTQGDELTFDTIEEYKEFMTFAKESEIEKQSEEISKDSDEETLPFKVGDTVQVVGDSKDAGYYHEHESGNVGEVVDFNPIFKLYKVDFDDNPQWHKARNLRLYDAESQELKVGDTVCILNSGKEKIGVIKVIQGECMPYYVDVDGEKTWHNASDLLLVKPSPKHLFKVGDIITGKSSDTYAYTTDEALMVVVEVPDYDGYIRVRILDHASINGLFGNSYKVHEFDFVKSTNAEYYAKFPIKFKVGDRVKVLSEDTPYRHYHAADTIGVVQSISKRGWVTVLSTSDVPQMHAPYNLEIEVEPTEDDTPKFKVGDKITPKKDDETYFTRGRAYEIVKIDEDGDVLIDDDDGDSVYIDEDYFELIDDKSETPESSKEGLKFKIGDKVQVIDNPGDARYYHKHHAGDIGDIVDVDDSTIPYNVDVNGVTQWHEASNLTAAPDENIEVGDVVEITEYEYGIQLGNYGIVTAVCGTMLSIAGFSESDTFSKDWLSRKTSVKLIRKK